MLSSALAFVRKVMVHNAKRLRFEELFYESKSTTLSVVQVPVLGTYFAAGPGHWDQPVHGLVPINGYAQDGAKVWDSFQ